MNNVAYELENARCEGCGRPAGPLGCCTTILKLRGLLVMYEFTLREISKTKTKTIRGECCHAGTCVPSVEACAFKSGANRAFSLHASAADDVLQSSDSI